VIREQIKTNQPRIFADKRESEKKPMAVRKGEGGSRELTLVSNPKLICSI
jgi:hypothetical protein